MQAMHPELRSRSGSDLLVRRVWMALKKGGAGSPIITGRGFSSASQPDQCPCQLPVSIWHYRSLQHPSARSPCCRIA